MSSQLSVYLKSKSEVKFASNLNSSIKYLFVALKSCKKVFIVYDSVLESKSDYFNKWKANLSNNSKSDLTFISLVAGEGSKSFENVIKLSRQVIEQSKGFSRSEIAIVAVGGGSVGDVVGFVASIIKRGLTFIQIPTTYLAAVDSSHGGKTAVNLSGYKNQIGTYYLAKLSLIDHNFLNSLNKEQVLSATGEFYKTSLIAGGKFWGTWIKSVVPKSELSDLNLSLWKALPESINIKLKIVSKDFTETNGKRLVLNLGHTLGHSIELNCKMPHGTAVLIGCMFSAHLSHALKILSANEFKKIINGVPLAFKTEFKNSNYNKSIEENKNEILASLSSDKKSISGNQISFVVIKKIGDVQVKRIDTKVIESILNDFIIKLSEYF